MHRREYIAVFYHQILSLEDSLYISTFTTCSSQRRHIINRDATFFWCTYPRYFARSADPLDYLELHFPPSAGQKRRRSVPFKYMLAIDHGRICASLLGTKRVAIIFVHIIDTARLVHISHSGYCIERRR